MTTFHYCCTIHWIHLRIECQHACNSHHTVYILSSTSQVASYSKFIETIHTTQMPTVHYYTTIQSAHLRIACRHAYINTSYRLWVVLHCIRIFFIYLIYRPDCKRILVQVSVRLAFAKRRAWQSSRWTAAVPSPTWCIAATATCNDFHQFRGSNILTRSYWRWSTSRHHQTVVA